VSVPARLPVTRQLLRTVLGRAALLVAAGGYPIREAERITPHGLPPTVLVPPGVDIGRFRPLEVAERSAVRARFGVAPDAELVVSVSRLVPRKGMDVLIEAAARLAPSRPDLVVVIGGTGRDASRLAALAARLHAPVRFLGRVADADLPALDGAADVWAMLCRNRWLGLEQEGFGIVFLEAAAAGVAVLAGRSGGAAEAVIDGETGTVVDRPADVAVVADALSALLSDAPTRVRYGAAGRARAVEQFDYDVLARTLDQAVAAAE
jgi:phosphatidylinositol alpha-1,6-mannosyltransferase